jgi:hypothetical protein
MEHDFEPVRGLPARPPAGERILWQGSPTGKALARRAFHVRGVAIYFLVLMAWRAASNVADGHGAVDTLLAVLGVLPLALAGLGVLALLGWLNARATVYTITDRRVVMRIGIVLTVTFNLPFARIVSADVRRHADGTVDLPLALHADDAIGWAHLWPHARPWRVRRPEPMMRGVPNGERVAALLAQAWAAATGGTVRSAADTATDPRSAGPASPHVGPASPAAGAVLAPSGRLAPDGAVAS